MLFWNRKDRKGTGGTGFYVSTDWRNSGTWAHTERCLTDKSYRCWLLGSDSLIGKDNVIYPGKVVNGTTIVRRENHVYRFGLDDTRSVWFSHGRFQM